MSLDSLGRSILKSPYAVLVYLPTMWGPRSIAKFVNNSNFTMVYGIYNELVTGDYKPTYNWGASHCRSDHLQQKITVTPDFCQQIRRILTRTSLREKNAPPRQPWVRLQRSQNVHRDPPIPPNVKRVAWMICIRLQWSRPAAAKNHGGSPKWMAYNGKSD